MTVTVLHRVDPKRNMARFYRLDPAGPVWPMLFYQRMGRIGRGGRIRSVPYPTVRNAQTALKAKQEVKQRRGYRLTMKSPSEAV